MTEEIELEIPARPEYLSLARLVMAAAAGFDPSFSDERIDDLRLAVSEACTNAIEEQQRVNDVNGAAEGVILTCVVDEGTVAVEVGDRGGGFELDQLESHPPVTDPARLDYERGLGIPLIRLLTDDVRWTPSHTGTTVRMTISGRRR